MPMTLRTAAATTLLLAASAASADPPAEPRWKPVTFSLDAGLNVEHESNLFHVQRRHEGRFDTAADPYERFHRMEGPSDTVTKLKLDAGWRWKHASKRAIALGVGASRFMHARNEIADRASFRLEAIFDVTKDDSVRLQSSYEPKHFAENRSREAFPGISVYERADESRFEWNLRWERRWSAKWSTSAGLDWRRRDFAPPFDARDGRRLGWSGGVRYEPVKRMALELEVRTRRARTPRVVQERIEKDRSYDEEAVSLRIRFRPPGHWRVTASAEWRAREFVTDVAADASRFGRTDHRLQLSLGCEKRFHGPWSFSAGIAETENDSGRELSAVPSRDLGWENLVTSAGVRFQK